MPNGVNYVAPHNILANMPKFCGLPAENALDHVKSFIAICITQNEHHVGVDSYRMRVFPLTLIDKAKTWLNHLPPNSIHSWDALQAKFFEKFFPQSKRLEIENQILLFRQRDDEELDEAWYRFTSLL